jgi:hypothetical protein
MLRAMLKITSANEALVRPAMEQLARELGGNVIQSVKDFYGRGTKVIAGIDADDIRGFGVAIENGRLIAVGDDFGCNMTMAEFMKRFTQIYQATAVQAALAQMGYQTNTTRVKMGLLVSGVKW